MNKSTTRRNFINGILTLPTMAALGGSFAFSLPKESQNKISHKLKLSLNLFSFNTLLKENKLDLFDMLDFCAEHNFDAMDPTGYYFPGTRTTKGILETRRWTGW